MNIQRSLYTLSETIKQYQVGNNKNSSYKDILVYLYKNNIFLWNDEEFNNGEMTPIELDSYFQHLSEKLSNEIDYIQIMKELCDEIDCDDENQAKYFQLRSPNKKIPYINNVYAFKNLWKNDKRFIKICPDISECEGDSIPKQNITKEQLDADLENYFKR